MSDGHPPAISPEQERLDDLEMIEACYAFPGDFPLAVIARNDQAVVDAVMAAVTADGRELRSHQRQESSGGKFVSHRLEVRVGSATEAHALYDTPDGISEKLDALRNAGVAYILLTTLGGPPQLRRFAREIMPAFTSKLKRDTVKAPGEPNLV